MLIDDVRGGLTASPKTLDPKWFYDALGSALFVAICELPEYYVTRCEREIFEEHGEEIARAFGTIDRLIELGSGNSLKTRLLLAALLASQQPVVYRPVDVDAQMLASSARDLAIMFPALRVEPLHADFRDLAQLGPASHSTLLFLGSSIGNLDHASAGSLLRSARGVLNPGDTMLIGFDLRKPKDILEPAYNDPLGVTAAFNLNVLARINRELGADFRLDRFEHRAFFNDAESRIEMHLVSREPQTVHIGDLEVHFARGETIHTENSYKYDLEAIHALAAAAGLTVERQWTDARGWFADVLLRAQRPPE